MELNSHQIKISNRQMPNGMTTVVHATGGCLHLVFVPCTVLLLRAASGEPGLLPPPPVRSKTKRHIPTYRKSTKIRPTQKHPGLKNKLFIFEIPCTSLAATINTAGDTSDTPSMQPTEHPRTSLPGWTGSGHMPRYHSCVRLPESSVP